MQIAVRKSLTDRCRTRYRSRNGRQIVVVFLCLLVSGCSFSGRIENYVHNGFKVGPNYCKPAAPVADAWIDEYDQRVRQELPNYADWWTILNDQPLNEIMENVYRQNLSLKVAGLRVLEAQYLRAIAVGSLFPQRQEAAHSYTHTQVSANIANTPPFRVFDTWSSGFNAFWELDFWGRFRRNIESADANLDASVEDYDALMVCLLAEAASAYVDLRTFQQRLAYAKANVESQEGVRKIADARFENGAVTKLDVTQATTNLENTRQLIPLFENQIRLANNRLCVVLGIPPRDLTQELGEGPIPVPPADVVVGIPANLLRRRPDVRAAERRVAVQSAQIGVATSNLLPHITLVGSIRHDSQNLSDLFNSGSWAGAIGPGYNWDILNYGRLANNVKVQDARFQQLAVTYQQTVLQANAEVESSINTFLKSQDQLVHNRAAMEASQESVELATVEYEQGAIDYNRVFNLQVLLVADQDNFASLQGQIANALIGTYKSLGGGWEIRLGIRRGSTPAEKAEQLPDSTIKKEDDELPSPNEKAGPDEEPSADEKSSATDESDAVEPSEPGEESRTIDELMEEAEELLRDRNGGAADPVPPDDEGMPHLPENKPQDAARRALEESAVKIITMLMKLPSPPH